MYNIPFNIYMDSPLVTLGITEDVFDYSDPFLYGVVTYRSSDTLMLTGYPEYITVFYIGYLLEDILFSSGC